MKKYFLIGFILLGCNDGLINPPEIEKPEVCDTLLLPLDTLDNVIQNSNAVTTKPCKVRTCDIIDGFKKPPVSTSNDFLEMNIYKDSIGGETVSLIVETCSFGNEWKETENKGKKVLRCYCSLAFQNFTNRTEDRLKSTGIPQATIDRLIVDKLERNWFIGIFRDSYMDFDLDWIKDYHTVPYRKL